MDVNKREIILKNKIVHFAFQLTRKEPNEIIKIESQLSDLLFSLKVYVLISQNKEETNKYFFFLTILFKLVAYTRDISIGKGQRELTYRMITVWYKYFPKHTIFLFQHLCSSPETGSWKDMKYLCHYIQYHTKILYDDKKEQFLQKIIRIANEQLYIDYFSSMYTPPSISISISMVSKWIPRENTKFHDIFERCCQDWSIHYISKKKYPSQKQQNYHKQKYRQILSTLNKKLDTTQIKQCEKQTNNLFSSNISINTKIRNEKYFYKYPPIPISTTKIENLSTTSTDTDTDTDNKNKTQEKTINNYFLGELIQNPNKTKQTIWNNIRHYIPNQDKYIIPFLDSNAENQIDGIAIAIMLSEISKLEDKIMLYNPKKATWINFQHISSSFPFTKNTNTDIHKIEKPDRIQTEIQNIQEKIIEIKRNSLSPLIETNKKKLPNVFLEATTSTSTSTNETKSMELLIESFIESKLSPEKIANLKIVFISDFIDMPRDHYSIIHSIFIKHKIMTIPQIIYWNISPKTVIQLPCAYNTPNVYFLAGTHSHNLNHLLTQFENPMTKTPFDYLCSEVNQFKYTSLKIES